MLARAAHDLIPCHHKRLLIGKGKALSAVDHREGGHKSRFSQNRIHRYGSAALADAVYDPLLSCKDLGIGIRNADTKVGGGLFIADGHKARRKLAYLLLQPSDGGTRGDHIDGNMMMPCDVKRLTSDRAGRAENGNRRGEHFACCFHNISFRAARCDGRTRSSEKKCDA